MTAEATTIAILLPDLGGGGAERLHVTLAAEWIRRGYAVDFVLLRAEGEFMDNLPDGARVFGFGVGRIRAAIGPLRKYLRRERPAVLLAAMWPLTIIAIIAAGLSLLTMRVIVSDHNTLSKAYAGRGAIHRQFLRLSMWLAYPFADSRIAVSKGVAADLSRLSCLEENRFTVIYNPAAKSNNSVRHGERPQELAADAKIVLSVGALKYQKNHELLIEAFSKMPAYLDAQLCILGEGELRQKLENLVSEKRLEGRVLLPGFRQDLSAYYQSADLFVLSSRYEGFGNVIVEAMEHGIPVVSTNCPSGPSEILADGRYGRLVPIGDADALVKAMLTALQESPDRESLKARARDFSVDKIADEYLRVMFPQRRAAVSA